MNARSDGEMALFVQKKKLGDDSKTMGKMEFCP